MLKNIDVNVLRKEIEEEKKSLRELSKKYRVPSFLIVLFARNNGIKLGARFAK